MLHILNLHEETKDLVNTMTSKDLVKHHHYQKLILYFVAGVCHINPSNQNFLFQFLYFLLLVFLFVSLFV